MKHLIKSLALAAALALPTFFAGNALAIPNCGTCAVGTAPSSHVTFGVTSTTLCSTCHTAPAIPATPGKPTTSATPASPGISLHPTTHGCGACVVGTAPGSVSAHKNVNTKMTACAMCHISGSTTGGTSGGTTGGHTDDHHIGSDRDDDDHHGTTGGMIGGHRDNHQGSPGNSDFGHSHQNGNKQHRDHDD